MNPIPLEMYKPHAPIQIDGVATVYSFMAPYYDEGKKVVKDGCQSITAIPSLGVVVEIQMSPTRPMIQFIFFPDGGYAKIMSTKPEVAA